MCERHHLHRQDGRDDRRRDGHQRAPSACAGSARQVAARGELVGVRGELDARGRRRSRPRSAPRARAARSCRRPARARARPRSRAARRPRAGPRSLRGDVRVDPHSFVGVERVERVRAEQRVELRIVRRRQCSFVHPRIDERGPQPQEPGPDPALHRSLRELEQLRNLAIGVPAEVGELDRRRVRRRTGRRARAARSRPRSARRPLVRDRRRSSGCGTRPAARAPRRAVSARSRSTERPCTCANRNERIEPAARHRSARAGATSAGTPPARPLPRARGRRAPGGRARSTGRRGGCRARPTQGGRRSRRSRANSPSVAARRCASDIVADPRGPLRMTGVRSRSGARMK